MIKGLELFLLLSFRGDVQGCCVVAEWLLLHRGQAFLFMYVKKARSSG